MSISKMSHAQASLWLIMSCKFGWQNGCFQILFDLLQKMENLNFLINSFQEILLTL